MKQYLKAAVRLIDEGVTRRPAAAAKKWINEAKTAPTRERRLATTVQWLKEGKHRNWKYDR